jgi:hypothetical protein
MLDENLIGLEEEGKKIKGAAEFRFTDKEVPELQFMYDIAIVKKQEPIIIIKDDRRNNQPKSRKSASLF